MEECVAVIAMLNILAFIVVCVKNLSIAMVSPATKRTTSSTWSAVRSMNSVTTAIQRIFEVYSLLVSLLTNVSTVEHFC